MEPELPDSPTTTIQEIKESLQSNNHRVKIRAVKNAIEILLVQDRFSAIEAFVRGGVVPHLVECSKGYNKDFLRFRACYVLTHIVSGTTEQIRAVVVAGAIPIFISLSSSRGNVKNAVVSALRKIIDDCLEFRDLVISHGAVPHLLSLLTPDISTKFRHNIIQTLLSLFNFDPDPPIEAVKLCLSAFSEHIYYSDPETVRDICWVISNLTSYPSEKIQEVIEAGFVPILVELLNKKDISVLKLVIRSIGNIANGENHQTQIVIDSGALASLKKLIPCEKARIVEKVCCAISNIASGNSNQIQALIDHGIVEDLLYVIFQGSLTSRISAVQIVSNLAVSGTYDQIMYLAKADVIPELFNILNIEDSNLLDVLLDAIINILNATNTVNYSNIASDIERCNGYDKLENLLAHEDEDVVESTCGIIKFALSLYGLENLINDEDEDVDVYAAALGAIKLAVKYRYDDEDMME